MTFCYCICPLVLCIQKSPHNHILFYYKKCIPLIVKALSKPIALVSELAIQLAQISIDCIGTGPASMTAVFQRQDKDAESVLTMVREGE